MHNLLLQMEAELNRLHQETGHLIASNTRQTPQTIERLEYLDDKRKSLVILIKKYTQIRSEFLELSGANSIY